MTDMDRLAKIAAQAAKGLITADEFVAETLDVVGWDAPERVTSGLREAFHAAPWRGDTDPTPTRQALQWRMVSILV